MAYGLEARKNARDLYVESGLSYEDVSRETGIAEQTLKNWGAAENWKAQREEYEREYSMFHAKVAKAKLRLANEALKDDKIDSQKIYALATLMKAGSNGAARGGSADKPALFIEFLGKLIEHVKAKDPDALRYLEPHIKSFAAEIKG